jgi:tetratricopeptide (TPR) repeat protein|tara:strand:+ start:1252 stop:2946 length:1695 start_codon:yes stop_codon:yes gene_type:complete
MIKNKIKYLFLAIFLSISTNVNAIDEGIFDENKPATIKNANAEFVYKFLLAEIASQRGDLNAAGHLYLDLAKLTKNTSLAQRATDVAGRARNGRLAMDSANVWRKLDKNSIAAEQVLAELFIASGNLTKARPLIEKLLKNEEETRADGFIYLNSILSKVENKKNALRFVLEIARPYEGLAEAHFSIAHAAFMAGNSKLAEAQLDIVEKIKPGWETAALFRGYTIARSSPEKAIDFYSSYLMKNPKSNGVRLQYAKALTNLKNYDTAKKQFLKLVNSSVASPEISLTVALLSIELNDTNLAETYLRQALERGYENPPQIFIYLAKIYYERNKFQDAITYLDKIKSGEFFLESKLLAAQFIAEKESVDTAISSLDSYPNLTEEERLKFLQFKTSMLYNADRKTESLDLMKKEEGSFKNSPQFKFDYAMLSEKLGNTILSEQLLKEAIKLKPDYALAYNALGYSFADRGVKLNEAKKYIEIALSIQPRNHYILDSMGWVYFRLGNLKLAYQFVLKAFNLQQDPEIAAHLGEILWKQGKIEEAKKILSNSLEKYPNNNIISETQDRLK